MLSLAILELVDTSSKVLIVYPATMLLDEEDGEQKRSNEIFLTIIKRLKIGSCLLILYLVCLSERR